MRVVALFALALVTFRAWPADAAPDPDRKWVYNGKAMGTVVSVFLWTASVATTPPLTEDDPLRDWLDRGFDLFGGLGRHPGMHTLVGLHLRPGDPEPFTKGPAMGGLASRNTGPASTRAETERITGKK